MSVACTSPSTCAVDLKLFVFFMSIIASCSKVFHKFPCVSLLFLFVFLLWHHCCSETLFSVLKTLHLAFIPIPFHAVSLVFINCSFLPLFLSVSSYQLFGFHTGLRCFSIHDHLYSFAHKVCLQHLLHVVLLPLLRSCVW